MTRKEQISNGFTEMMKGFWGNQDLKVPDFETPCKQEPCYEYNPNLLVETCRNIAKDYADVDQFVCSECGIELQDWDRVERDEDTGDESFYEYTLKYCPNCGRRIEYDC